jgi:MerR family redox-sensitive transcriptional activator SoxR
MAESTLLTIGEVAARAGVATSALRFYESRGLIESERTVGNQRRYRRSVLRKVAFVKAAQAIGISLAEVQAALESLPAGRTPNRRDWGKLSKAWQAELDDRIRALEGLRDDLSDCIGCGCLSLSTCALFNPGDKAGERGPGPRFLMGEEPGGSLRSQP